jgi:hypothetical protein
LSQRICPTPIPENQDEKITEIVDETPAKPFASWLPMISKESHFILNGYPNPYLQVH